jgi:hypothetical protein
MLYGLQNRVYLINILSPKANMMIGKKYQCHQCSLLNNQLTKCHSSKMNNTDDTTLFC